MESISPEPAKVKVLSDLEDEKFEESYLFDLYYKKLGLYSVEKESYIEYIQEIKNIFKQFELED